MPSSQTGLTSLLDRRKFLAQSSISAAAIAGFAWLRPGFALAQTTPTEYVEVKTAYGRVRGQREGDLVTFRGVPYAGSVSGANRFKAAPPLEPWTGTRDALQLGAPSWQPGKTYFGVNEPTPQEDCLFLNVWTPAADGHKRPVMFYSHGGGFATGSGGSIYQDGGNLARAYDVVVVATNHRLGLLGYLFLGELGGEEYATSGNQGLLDIKDGLKWVHENIGAFGGDPNNVMIFGESGGGAKTSCLYALPSAEKYFNKASIESGPGIRMLSRDQSAETTRMTLAQLGLSADEWRKLIDTPVDKLLAAQVALGQRPGAGLRMDGGRKGLAGRAGGFSPVVDGTILPHHPFDPDAPTISKGKPLIVGSNRDETLFFFFQMKDLSVFELTDATLKARLEQEYGTDAETILATYKKTRPEASPADLYTAITTAGMIWVGAVTIAERKYAQHGAAVYMYMFTHASDFIIPGTNHPIGAAHALEIPFKFDNVGPVSHEAQPNGAEPPRDKGMSQIIGSDPDREKAAHNMSEMWSTFARTGRPAAKGQPQWPAYTTEKRSTMQIDDQCRVVNDPFSQERIMWESLTS